MPVIYESPPPRLWKYREWDKDGHTRDMIVQGDVYYASPKTLNDPFEFRWLEQLPKTRAERVRYAKEMCAKIGPNDSISRRRAQFLHIMSDLEQLSEERKNGRGPTRANIALGVFCVSSLRDNVLMWSHYAKNHKGVCVGIRADGLTGKRFLPVQYRETVPVLDAWTYIQTDNNSFVEVSLVKAIDWKYEDEWRSVNTVGVHHFPECVDQVIIGALASDQTRAAVHEAVAAAPQEIEVFNARLSNSRYQLDIVSEKATPPPRLKKRGRNRVH